LRLNQPFQVQALNADNRKPPDNASGELVQKVAALIGYPFVYPSDSQFPFRSIARTLLFSGESPV
jgi:hypothetical protein